MEILVWAVIAGVSIFLLFKIAQGWVNMVFWILVLAGFLFLCDRYLLPYMGMIPLAARISR